MQKKIMTKTPSARRNHLWHICCLNGTGVESYKIDKARELMNSTAQHATDLIKTKQAARLLGVTVQTVKNYIYSGKLKSYRTLGGHHRIMISDLQELASLRSHPS